MFRHSLLIACRSLRVSKKFTLIAVAGLSLGITTWLFIMLYVADEVSFDNYNVNARRIFRINTDIKTGDSYSFKATTSPAIGPALVSQFPEVEKVVRILPEALLVKKADGYLHETRAAYADTTIFDVFSLPLIAGNPKTALLAPNAVVINESTARKYFNSTGVVGNTIYFSGDSAAHLITGVMRDIPANSHFQFDWLLSMQSLKISSNKAFNAFYPFSTYLLLKENAKPAQLENAFPVFLKAHLDFLDDMEKAGNYIRLNLIALTDIHLKSNRSDELGVNGNYSYLQIFSVIAFAILILACINFINLSIARFSKRAKETGVRKVLGAGKPGLITRFLCESFLVAAMATLVSMLAYWFLLPAFNVLTGKNMSLATIGWKTLLGMIITAIVITGLLAGLYPAFSLSSFQPVKVLKGNFFLAPGKSHFRNTLVVFQFTVSVAMIIGTGVVFSQLQFMLHKDPGFSSSQRMIVKNINELRGNKASLFKDGVNRLNGVSSASLSSFYPAGDRRWTYFLSFRETGIQSQLWPVDADYLSTLNMQIVTGRNFSEQFRTDSSALLLNETAAAMLGIAKDPLNRQITLKNFTYQVIGVVKDFHFGSLKDHIQPLAMVLMTPGIKKLQGDGPDNLIIKTNRANYPQLLDESGKIWKSLSNNHPLVYSFMDQDLLSRYNQEQTMGKLFTIFSALAILIACTGLFGLTAYNLEVRRRELSIRKVLGANLAAVLVLLSKDFMKLVLLAIAIAVPVAWLVMHKWLDGYAYHTRVNAWIIVSAATSTLLFAIVTVSYHAIRGANINPVVNLKAE